MKKTKVLQVFASLNMGGAESRMMDIYRNIVRDEVEFVFLTLTKDDNQYYEKEIENLGGIIIKIASPRDTGILKHIKELKKLMKEGCYDAVHAHTSYHSGLVMYAAKKAKVPVRITHARTTGSKRKSKIVSILIKVGRFLINKFSTHRFAVSNNAGLFLFGKHDFSVLPNAIDLKRYICHGEFSYQIRNEICLDANAIIIGHIGRFDNMKNHRFIIECFKQYKNNHSNTQLVLIGDGTLKKEIEEKVDLLNLSDSVHFLGLRGDVPRLISAFDVLFFPSIYEGLPGTVLEAQAAGIPVVGSLAVPKEADLEIGLVEKISLSDSIEKWNDALDRALNKSKPSLEVIKDAFNKHGYSIDAVTEKYVNTYKGLK